MSETFVLVLDCNGHLCIAAHLQGFVSDREGEFFTSCPRKHT